DVPALASLLLSSRILPTTGGGPGTDLVIPSLLSMRVVGEDEELGFQTELRGSGAITEGGDRWLDFLVRAPGSLDDSPLGRREVYRLRYEDPAWQLQFGDGFYSLSSLTTRQSEARGVGFAWSPDRAAGETEMGGFYTLGDGLFDEQAAALYYKQAVTDELALRLNAAAIKSPDGGTRRRELLSLEASGSPWEPVDFNLEVAQGRPADGGWAGAYRGRIRAEWDEAELTFNTTRAGPDYPGPYQDLHYTRTGVSVPITDDLTGTAAYQTHARNLDRSPGRLTASREERWQAGLRYDWAPGWHVGLGFEQVERVDKLQPADFEVIERLGRLEVGRTASDLSWIAQVRAGRVADRLEHTEELGTDYRLDLSWRPDESQLYQLFTGLSTTEAGSLLGGGRDFLGVRGTVDVTPELQLFAGWVGYGLGDHDRRHEEGELAARYRADDDTSWEIVARIQDGAHRQRTIPFLASYTVPLDLKVGRRKSVGTIEGRIAAEGGDGVPGVILMAGGVVAVSCDDGSFRFPPLPAGTYALDIDLSTLGLDQIAQGDVPLEVIVIGGETSTVALSVVPAASLSGRLQPPAAPRSTERQEDRVFAVEQEPLDPAALDNIVLELTNGTETLRRVTTDGG
ncbi:MAG TPA: carboxypeptidase-like regulatory domain-containing protein, partial [bacterium]|nr:carboxypeptidase-like regulatory domain-containing protein [bacterium]